jgi:hypothetical protein
VVKAASEPITCWKRIVVEEKRMDRGYSKGGLLEEGIAL